MFHHYWDHLNAYHANVLLMVICIGNGKSCLLLMRVWIIKPVFFWSIRILILRAWMKLGKCLNGWLVIHVSLKRSFWPPKCLSLIHVLFMQDHIMRNNLRNLVPLSLTYLIMLSLFMILFNNLNMIPILVLMLFLWSLDLDNLGMKWKTHSKSVENLSCAFMDQFSKLVKSHVESIMLILHETDVKVGPTVCKGYLLGDFESLYHLATNFKLILIYLTLR